MEPAAAKLIGAGIACIGMGGAGGCSAWAEPAGGYGAAYVTRQLGGHDRGELVWEAITSLL